MSLPAIQPPECSELIETTATIGLLANTHDDPTVEDILSIPVDDDNYGRLLMKLLIWLY